MVYTLKHSEMPEETSQQSTKPVSTLSPELEESLKGAKLVFGDKIVDPNDRRVRYPHRRIIEKEKDITSSGLLQTGGHRPKTEDQ